MQSLLFNLPAEILTLIYQFDSTYKSEFTDKVMSRIWAEVLKRSMKSFKLPATSYFGPLSFNKEIEKGTEAVKYAASHVFKMMGFWDNYMKKTCLYGTGNDFHLEDLSAVCIEIDDYVYDSSDNYEKRTYLSIVLYLQHKKVFDGVVFSNTGEFDNDDNANIMMVDYDGVNRTALFQYID